MTNDRIMIDFDKPKRERLREAYQKALEEGKDRFDFDGHEVLTRYAYYLLEYLDQALGD